MKKSIGIVVFIAIVLSISFYVVMHKKGQRMNSPLENSQKTLTMNGMQIKSPAFVENSPIPSTYTCDGNNTNPELTFSGIPETAKSLALIVDDPDAPMGTFVHWVVFNIPPTMTQIPENAVLTGVIEGKNGAGKTGFIGPCPPSGTHRYFFKLYALDTQLSLDQTADKAAVEKAMQGHILDQAQYMGTYQRTK